MSILSKSKALMGGWIDIQQKGSVVEIWNIPSRIIMTKIMKEWSTSRINKYMFSITKSRKIVLEEFFLLELVFILKELLKKEAFRSYREAHSVYKLIESIENNTWLSNTKTDHADILDYKKLRDMHHKPLPHQEEFFQQYNDNVPKYRLKGYILATPPGGGKTYTGLALGQMLNVSCMVIVSPKNAIRNVWEKEIKLHIKGDKKIWISDEPGDPPKGMDYYICHYEALEKLFKITQHLSSRSTLINLDECHNFNEIKSQRSQNFIKFCKEVDCQHVLWSSGTPIKAVGSEMITVLNTIDPYFNEEVQERFKKVFGMDRGRAGNVLSHRLGLVTYKIDKSLIVKGEPIIETRYVKIPKGEEYTLENIGKEMADYIEMRFAYYRLHEDRYRKTYKSVIDEHRTSLKTEKDKKAFEKYQQYVRLISGKRNYQSVNEEMKYANQYEEKIMSRLDPKTKKEFKDAKSFVKYLPLKIRGEALGNVLSKKRTECHVDMVRHIDLSRIIREAASKTIIFTSFVEVVETVERYLKEIGFKPLTVYGKTNNDLLKNVNKFEKAVEINPLVATLQSLSTAVPLTMANTVIFINQPFRIHIKDQAISRAHRIGQEHQVYVYDILLDTGDKPNISTRSQEIMEWSKEMIDVLMGTESSVSQESYSDIPEEWFLDTTRPIPSLEKNKVIEEIISGAHNTSIDHW